MNERTNEYAELRIQRALVIINETSSTEEEQSCPELIYHEEVIKQNDSGPPSYWEYTLMLIVHTANTLHSQQSSLFGAKLKSSCHVLQIKPTWIGRTGLHSALEYPLITHLWIDLTKPQSKCQLPAWLPLSIHVLLLCVQHILLSWVSYILAVFFFVFFWRRDRCFPVGVKSSHCLRACLFHFLNLPTPERAVVDPTANTTLSTAALSSRT